MGLVSDEAGSKEAECFPCTRRVRTRKWMSEPHRLKAVAWSFYIFATNCFRHLWAVRHCPPPASKSVIIMCIDRPTLVLYTSPELYAQETAMNDETKNLILGIFEASLDAQLRAVRRLRHGEPSPVEPRPRKSLSQVDMAFDILKKARSPLHISVILERIQLQFGVSVDRESLVSSLTKKVARGDRFLRPEKNTFSLLEAAR